MPWQSGSVILAGARTPMGRLLGALRGFSGVDLGGIAIKGALERSGLPADKVGYVILGQVLQAGEGQISARQAAVKAGIPMTVPALTINKVCLSGLDAIALADQFVRAGEFDVVVAGGMESMSNAPHLLPKSREGVKYGDATLVDSMAYDGLWDSFTNAAMGALTDKENARLGITREQQDEFAARSHQRAAAAQKEGRFAAEIVTVEVPHRRGDPLVVDRDEGVRPETTPQSLAKLLPAFAADGTVTARRRRSRMAHARSSSPARPRPMSWACLGWPRSALTAWWRGRIRRCNRNPRTPPRRPCAARGWTSPTLIWRRSTRRLPRWRCSQCVSWASTRTGSMSTAVPSHWGIRLACPVPG